MAANNQDYEAEDDDNEDVVDAGEDTAGLGPDDRTKELSTQKRIQDQLCGIYQQVIGGFDDKNEQTETIDRCWDIYNCVLNDQQSYVGTSQAYVPIVHDAIEARVTRYINELFPATGRCAEVVSSDGNIPYEIISLLDHYVRAGGMRDNIGPSLIRSGDVSGQYSLYADWNEIERTITQRVEKKEMETELGTGVEGSDSYNDIEVETIKDARPGLSVLDTRDFVVLPGTVDTIDDAEIVAIAMRLTKRGIRKRIKDGTFTKEGGKQLLEGFGTNRNNQSETQKKSLWAAGVRKDSQGNETALVYQIWTKLTLKPNVKRLCVAYIAGEDLYLSCKRNPYWNDRVPVISQAATKVPGSFWGRSKIEGGVERLQYAANDAVNMGFDSAQYALLPIVMTDPEKNPRAGSMIMAMAAIWETSPQDTQFANFPQVWKDAFTLVEACKDQIMQSLGTNPAMIPNGGAGKKPTQAQIAQEQQVALENTSGVVSLLESGIFSKVLRWMYDLDYQFRDKALLVKQWGPLGHYAAMQEIPLLASGKHYEYFWYGSEGFKSAQQVQQMIAGLNVLRGIPPQILNGRRIDIGPILDKLVEITYGPRMAPQILIDQRHQLSIEPERENEMLEDEFLVDISPADDDIAHLQSHQAAMKSSGDPGGYFRAHMIKHMAQLQAKNQAAQAEQMGPPPAMPGAPGAAGPGMPDAPRIGAQPGQTRPVQAPPGTIPEDQMSDAGRMPR